MFRDRMNRIIGSKAFNIVFAILVSMALWLYIAYAENTDVTKLYSGLKVEFAGDEELTNRDLIVTGISTNTVTLKIEGSRSEITRLFKSSISVTVDLSSITKAGVHLLPYDVTYDSKVDDRDLKISDASADYITVTVSKLIEKDVLVKGVYEGKISEGYNAEELEFSPQTITVFGPEEVLSQISYAWVVLARDSVSKTVADELSYVLMDTDGNQVSSEYITSKISKISVTMPVVMVKEVNLAVNLVPGAGATSANTRVTISPESITLSGDAETLSQLNQIVLGTIDLSDFSVTHTETYRIPVPNDTKNDTGITEATVTVEVIGLDTAKLTVSNITASNVPTGYTATIITQNLDVTVRGNADNVSQISADNIRVVADLSGLGNAVGTFSIDAKIYVDGFTDIGAVGSYPITVSVETSAGS